MSDQTHSSVANTMRIIDVDPLVVPAVDDHLTGAALAAALDADGDPGSVCAVVATAGTTNAGLVDDLAGIAARVPANAASGCTSTRRTAAPRCSRRASATAFAGIEHADSLVDRPAQVAVRAVRLRRAALPRSGVRPVGAHAGRVVPRRDPRRRRRVEPVRLRVPTHPPRPRPAAVVLARGATAPTRTATRSRRVLATRTRGRGAHRGAPPPRARARARALGRAVPPHRLGRSRLRRAGRHGCSPSRSRSSRRRAGTARPSPASRSCTPRPRSTIVDEILATTA